MDEDIGMSDGSDGKVRRRGRQARSGPMGERVSRIVCSVGLACYPGERERMALSLCKYADRVPAMLTAPHSQPTQRNARNAPAVLPDKPARSSSVPTTSKPKSTDPPTQNTIDILRLFLLARYSQPDRMLNMENMAEDPVLKEHKLLAPGQPGAPANMAGAIWKLAKEMFPDVSIQKRLVRPA